MKEKLEKLEKIRALVYFFLGAFAILKFLFSGYFKGDNAIGAAANSLNYIILIMGVVLVTLGGTKIMKLKYEKEQ